jgi:uncharacterized protein
MSNNEFRFGKYVSLVDSDNCVLLFNALNGRLVRIKTEIDKMKRVFDGTDPICSLNSAAHDALVRQEFIVDTSVNERDTAVLNYMALLKQRKMFRITAYVTNACNFRCVYCPQPHTPEMMSADTLDSVIAFVDKVLAGGQYNEFLVSWFGGEPLLNVDLVKRGMFGFREVCKKYGINPQGSMTTNGYNLDKDTARQLLNLGVNEFQITLDGMGKTHNSTRKLKNGSATWQRIWNNLLSLNEIDLPYRVALRLNINKNTIASAKDLCLLAIEELGERFVLQPQVISNMGGEAPIDEMCDAPMAFEVMQEMYRFLVGENQKIDALLHNLSPCGMMCSCHSPDYLVIREDGHICKCELTISDDRNMLGEINKGASELRLAPYVTPNMSEQCVNCRVYPLCMGLCCPFKKATGVVCDFPNAPQLDEYVRIMAESVFR